MLQSDGLVIVASMRGLVLAAPIASAAVHISRDLAAARTAAASAPVESAAPA